MIRKMSQVVVILGAMVAALALQPAEVVPPLDLGVQPAPKTFVGCLGLEERDLSTTLLIGSVIRGPILATLVARGDVAPVETLVDRAGGAVLNGSDLGVAGPTGILVELPTADAAAAAVAIREGAVAASACTPAAIQTVLALGGSTGTGESLDLALTNPYAVDALVSVGSSSESGDDSAEEIASLLVPAGGTVVRALETLLPLRQSLSVRIEVQRGSVHAALFQGTSGDISISEAVAPSQDWWVPALAVADSSAHLVIATASPLSVDVRVDVYADGTLTEGVYENEIEARSQVDIPVADLNPGPAGFRISADGPVVVALVVNGETTRGVAPATTLSTEWVLAGSGSFVESRAWVFNPGEVAAELVLQPLLADAPATAATVAARSAASVNLGNAGAGFLIRSSTEISVLWSARQGGLALAAGHPLTLAAE